MAKQAPTLGRLLVMTAFALSCFGLLLFLWLSFGGPSPLRPKGWQFRAAFPEAVQLAEQADVRIAGVKVGTVRAKRLDPASGRTIADIELAPKYAPLSSDARAVLRQKAILGETYVELTLGSRGAPKLTEGQLLAPRRIQDSVELDEILDTLDPYTQAAFRTWQRTAGDAIDGRAQDLNDALGTLPEFAAAGGDLLEVLDGQRRALRGLVRNTGAVFGAITEREDQLRALISNSSTVFRAIDSQRNSFADVWRTFPTFLDESKATFARLERFAADTRPLVRELRPAFDDLGPTLRNVGTLAPDLRRLFVRLGPLIEQSRRSLPATRQVFEGLRPLLGALGPWLSEVNPTLDWLGQYQNTLTDVFANLGVATQARAPGSSDPRATGHYLRQFGPTGAETASVHPRRLGSNRGNTYFNPLELVGPRQAARGILPAWDCENAGGEKDATEGASGSAACKIQPPYRFGGAERRFPHVQREDYSAPGSQRRPLRP